MATPRKRRPARIARGQLRQRSALSRPIYLTALALGLAGCDEGPAGLVNADSSPESAAETATDSGEREGSEPSDAAVASIPSGHQAQDSGFVDSGVPCSAGTSSSFGARDGAQRPAGQIAVHADYLFPDATLVDWVSYVEQLAAVTVLSEEELPPGREVLQRGEGYIGRSVLLRIDETVWLNRAATAQMGELHMDVWGWILAGCERHQPVTGQAPRIIPGGRYIVPLVRYESGFAFLTDGSVMAFPGDPIATDDVAAHGQNEIARQLSQMSISEMVTALMMTPRDPVAERYWDLPPEERVRAVAMAAHQGMP